jgi:TRAP transporter TAXI family solute receptor
LPAKTLALAALERRGSQSDSKAPAGEEQRVVYFDARLRLERDFDFGSWDAPGVAGLVSALGAGPKGIAGLRSGGNKAGDVLSVHGTALYRWETPNWVPVATPGFRPANVPSYASDAARGPAAIVDAIRKVIDSVPGGAALAEREAIEQELIAAHAVIRARLARLAAGYAIAAGPEHGQYLRFAQALSDEAQARTVPLVTQGGDENLRMLRSGKVSLALAQGDAALDAYEGKGSFATDGPYGALRAIGSLYPEPVHVLVRNDAPVASLSGLRSRRIAIGVPGSASRATALRVLQAHGLGPSEFTAAEMPLGEALVALRQRNLDAVVQVIGIPADTIREALAEVPLRMLSLSEPAIRALLGANAGYFAFAIPRGTYANQKEPVRTVATAALLLAGADLSDTEVASLTRFVFRSGRDFAARGSAQGMQVSAATARHGLSIPMHVAALKALDASK